jgi:hypothetical protein
MWRLWSAQQKEQGKNRIQTGASFARKDYFFDKKKVQLCFTLEFHAAVRGE